MNRTLRNALLTTAVAIAASTTLTACGSAKEAHPTAVKHAAGTSAKVPSAPKPARVTVTLAWSHTSNVLDDKAVTYVAHVTNSGSSLASVAIDAQATDKTGTIVGSDEETLPNIPADSSFDYLGQIGGSFAELTGTPAKITVTQEPNAFGMAGAVQQPMLAVSDLKLSPGSTDDSFSSDPLAYNASVKVTNNTKNVISDGVTQQVVLYDASGKIVGGDTGSSDNVPDTLPVGARYQEQWTGIPATAHAARAVYTVWGS